MTNFFNFISWFFFFFYYLLIIFVTLKVLIKKRTMSSLFAWLLIVYCFPGIGIFSYLYFGEISLGRFRTKNSKAIWLSKVQWLYHLKKNSTENNIFVSKNNEIARTLFTLCKNKQGFSDCRGHHLKLLTVAKNTINILIKDIQMASKNIEMIFYIWFPGGMADEVAKSLISAAKRGVNCRLILDSVGSMHFFKSPWMTKMCKSGIQIVKALKINLFRIFVRRMDLRQHRKLILIDNYIAYTGSMNLIDPYFFKKNIGIGTWIDLMIRVEGPIVTVLGSIFSCDWEIETGECIFPSISNKNFLSWNKEDNYIIQAIASGPGFQKNMIEEVLLTSIYSAKYRVIMTTPYFVPTDNLLKAICTAACRGLDVILIIPLCNDSILVHWASRSFFDTLLKSGVKIYQFERGLLHTKSMLIDDNLSFIGTLNLDMRSLCLNFEITLVIDSIKFGKNLAQLQYEYIASSKLLDKKHWSKRNWTKRFFERFFYFFSPCL